MVSIWPMVDYKSENFEEMKAKGLLTRVEKGVRIDNTYMGNTIQYDPTNPEAREYAVSYTHLLRSAARSSSMIVGIAVASQDGVLYQFDKNEMRTTGSKYIWDENSMNYITDAFSSLKEKSADNIIPRYEIITHPMLCLLYTS